MTEEIHIFHARLTMAILDGWNANPSGLKSDAGWGVLPDKPDWQYVHQLPDYPRSHDAILPVVKNICTDQVTRVKFVNILRGLLPQPASDFDMMLADPLLICQALLKAVERKEKV